MLDVKEFMNLVLDFGEDWVVTGIKVNSKLKTVHIDIEYCSKVYEDPTTLELGAKLYDHGEYREWRHLDILDHKTYIRTRIPRVVCKDGSIKRIHIGWASKHDRHTYLFEVKVIELLQCTKNQTKTAAFLRCGFRLINRILHRCAQRGLSRRGDEINHIEHISIDEKAFRKGHSYVTVLSHPGSGVVLDVIENRDTKAAKELIMQSFTPEHRKRIQTVSTDMWQPYLNAVASILPNAEIVHDRFHLVKYLNECMDKVRRREVRQQTLLKGSRYALLKSLENMTDSQFEKFEQIKAANLEVTDVWHIRQNFKDIFDKTNNDKDAANLLLNWAADSISYGIAEVNKVVKMMTKHFKGVVNAMISNLSNAMAERLNGKIQEIKLTARGYRTFKNFRSAILFFHGGLDLYPLRW